MELSFFQVQQKARDAGDVGDKRRNETQILSTTKNDVVVVVNVVTEGVETSLKKASPLKRLRVKQKNVRTSKKTNLQTCSREDHLNFTDLGGPA